MYPAGGWGSWGVCACVSHLSMAEQTARHHQLQDKMSLPLWAVLMCSLPSYSPHIHLSALTTRVCRYVLQQPLWLYTSWVCHLLWVACSTARVWKGGNASVSSPGLELWAYCQLKSCVLVSSADSHLVDGETFFWQSSRRQQERWCWCNSTAPFSLISFLFLWNSFTHTKMKLEKFLSSSVSQLVS